MQVKFIVCINEILRNMEYSLLRKLKPKVSDDSVYVI